MLQFPEIGNVLHDEIHKTKERARIVAAAGLTLKQENMKASPMTVEAL